MTEFRHIDFSPETLKAAHDRAHAWSLPLIDTTRWIGATPPAPRWIVPGWLLAGTACLFVGEDGIGKSLLGQQLATAAAAGRKFLGLEIEQVASLYVTCEDAEEQLWHRQRAINAALGVPIEAAPAGLASLVGHTDVQLGHFDADGRFQSSVVLTEIAEAAKARKAGLVVLDNVAHFFAGNENIRPQVAAFCSALEWLAIETGAAVVMLAHPNKAGAEYSGSTGWSAHVRQRWFLERPADCVDRDARVLRKSKSNYASSGDEIAFRWHQWAFVRAEDLGEDQAAEIAANVQASADNLTFLRCLAQRTKERRAVSERASKTYAPTVFAAMPEAKGTSKQRLEAAMDRLFRIGAIERAELWRGDDRKPVFGLQETAGNGAGNAAIIPQEMVRETAGNLSRETQATHTLHTTYVQGAAPLGLAAPKLKSWADASPDDPDDIDWGDAA